MWEEEQRRRRLVDTNKGYVGPLVALSASWMDKIGVVVGGGGATVFVRRKRRNPQDSFFFSKRKLKFDMRQI